MRHFLLVPAVLLSISHATVSYTRADPFVRTSRGNGMLIDKLVVIRDNPRLRLLDNSSSTTTPVVKTLSIFWRLKTNTPSNQRNNYFLAGDQNGRPLIWIHSNDVRIWHTRCMINPLRNSGETTFTVFSDPHLTRPMLVIPGRPDPHSNSNPSVAIVTGAGHTPTTEKQNVLVLNRTTNNSSVNVEHTEFHVSQMSERLRLLISRNDMRHLLYRLEMASRSLNRYRDNPTHESLNCYHNHITSLYHTYLYGTAGTGNENRLKAIRENIFLVGTEGLLFDIDIQTADHQTLLDMNSRLKAARRKAFALYDSPNQWFAINNLSSTRCCYISSRMLP